MLDKVIKSMYNNNVFFVKAGMIMEKSLMIINNINHKSKLYEAYSILVNQKQGIIAYKGR